MSFLVSGYASTQLSAETFVYLARRVGALRFARSVEVSRGIVLDLG